ncbi:MAG: hypothetical protein ACE5OZ_19115 [Candidatus Heimdallarchaeota archaeon]
MASASQEPPTNEENQPEEPQPKGRGNRLQETALGDVILWTLKKLLPIEERLYRYGIFTITQDSIVNQKIALLAILQGQPTAIKRQALRLAGQSQEERAVKTIKSETEFIEIIAWAIRKLEVIQTRLEHKGVFDFVDTWLVEQLGDLFWLLQKHPKHLLKQLAVKQQAMSLEKQNKGEQIERGGNP